MTPQAYKPVATFRLLTLMLCMALVSGVLLWRAVDLHVINKTFLQDQGDARFLRVMPLAAHRGMLTDRNGEPLAISTPVDSVWVVPRDFLAVQPEWPRLAALLGIVPEQLSNTVLERQNREFVYIKRHVAPALAEEVMSLNLPGVSLQREYHRYYPMGEVAAHVVGFTDIDDKGQEGLELAYDQWLQGKPGSQRVIRDRLGRIIRHVELINKPAPGRDLALSIDRRLQYLAYRELKEAVLKHKARSGSIVILDVHSGEVLAMVNQPAFNPNNRERLQRANMRNRAVTDLFEPGSTIKPFTVAAALQSNKFRADSFIDTAPGFYQVGSNSVRDIRNYGRLNLAEIVAKSSNVGASKIALALPAESLWRLHSRLGFGMISNSGFPGEAGGLLTHASQWRQIEQATLAFGYGMSVTPLQLARAYGAIATDGVLKPVSFVQQESHPAGEQVMEPRVAASLRLMLEQVTSDNGTGGQARFSGYRVAGKTGTVKKATVGGYSDERHTAVFAGMAPASAPRLVMVVVIDEPGAGQYYGGQVAAPVFSRVMAGALRLLDVAPDDLAQDRMHMAGLEISKAGVHP